MLAERAKANGAAEPGANRGTTPSRDASVSAQQTLAAIGISHDQSAAKMRPKPTTADNIAAMPTEASPGAVEPVRSRSPSGMRMRRMRERQRGGLRAVHIDVSAPQVEALALAGFLDASLRDDAAEVALGLRRLLDQHLARYSVTPIQAPAGCS